MILDAFQLFTGATTSPGNSDGKTDSPTTGTQASSNILDYGGPQLPVLANLQGARDMGIGDDPALKLLVQVTTTFLSAASMIITISGAPDNGSGIPGSYTVWWTSPTYTEAQLVAGARLLDMDFPRPPAAVGVPRFVRINYTTSGTHTAGALVGAVVLDRFDQMYNSTANQTIGGYPAGITVAN